MNTHLRSGIMQTVSAVLVMVGFLITFSLSHAAGSNLVTNGDLETVSPTSSTTPQGWNKDFWGTVTAAFTYPVAGNSGGKAAQVQITKYTSGDAKWYFNNIPVTVGTTYQITDNYQSNVVSEVDVDFLMSNGTDTYVWLANPAATAGTSWGNYTGSVVAPAGAVSMTVFHLIQSVGTLSLDNMSITNGTTTPPPLLPIISSFTANPSNFMLGTASSTTLSWNVSSASTTSINQGVGVVTGNSTTTPVVQTTTYVLTATNPQGSVSATTTVTVTPVAPPPPPTCSLSVNPTSILIGSSSLLSWTSQNTNGGSINQGVGAVNANGSQSVSPTQTTTYTGTFGNGTASSTCSTTLTVTSPAAPKPTITSFVATPATIIQGSSTVLSWVVANASTTSIDQSVGVVAGSNKTVSPTATTTYTLTATNPQGSVTANVTVNVVLPPPPPIGNNLISNGNFEQGTTNKPTGWQSDSWGSLTAQFSYPVTGNGGGKAAKLVVSNWRSGDAKWGFSHVPVSSHTIYQFSDDYQSTVVDNISVEIKMSNGSYQYQWVANAPATSGTTWGHLVAQITVPAGAVSMTVLHTLDRNGTLVMDNASLAALSGNAFAQGMVTLTFDDGLTSQYNNARPIINAAGLKATFGIITQGVRDITGDNAAMTWAQITTLKNDGDEIAAHTRTHADLTLLNATQLQSEVQGSMSDLIAKGFAPKTFIYPLGAENPAVETAVKNSGFIGARGSYWGLNSPTANRWAAYDIRFDKATTPAQINAMIDQAIADKRWLVIELHDVLATGGDEFSITPSKLQTVVNYIKSTGVKTVTLQDGMALMQSQ